MEQIKQVHTKRGTGRAIAKALGISEVTVSKAICGVTNTDLAKKIRYTAVKEYGGIAIN